MKALRRMRESERGFTLIEIMIVVLIIGILLAIAVPNFVKARETSRTKTCISNLKQIDAAKEQWAMDFKKGPTDLPDMAMLSTEAADSGKYIKTWPTCPSGGSYDAGIGDIETPPVCSRATDGTSPTHVLP